MVSTLDFESESEIDLEYGQQSEFKSRWDLLFFALWNSITFCMGENLEMISIFDFILEFLNYFHSSIIPAWWLNNMKKVIWKPRILPWNRHVFGSKLLPKSCQFDFKIILEKFDIDNFAKRKYRPTPLNWEYTLSKFIQPTFSLCLS